ncbi:hypothetical protein NL676_017817 [Syzygium grande]|nr:hypothetical protein NL676_017817 [Syzygium grande]
MYVWPRAEASGLCHDSTDFRSVPTRLVWRNVRTPMAASSTTKRSASPSTSAAIYSANATTIVECLSTRITILLFELIRWQDAPMIKANRMSRHLNS